MSPFELITETDMRKKMLETFAGVMGTFLVLSMLFSLFRFMGHDECNWVKNEKDGGGLTKVCPNTPCAPLFIDKLEPFISTRWFCEQR